MAIAVLTLAICSGMATAIVGPGLGLYIAVTLLVLLVGFTINLSVGWLFFRNMPRDETPREHDHEQELDQRDLRDGE